MISTQKNVNPEPEAATNLPHGCLWWFVPLQTCSAMFHYISVLHTYFVIIFFGVSHFLFLSLAEHPVFFLEICLFYVFFHLHATIFHPLEHAFFSHPHSNSASTLPLMVSWIPLNATFVDTCFRQNITKNPTHKIRTLTVWQSDAGVKQTNLQLT